MTSDDPHATFEETTALEPGDGTLIEGLPGLGLVASIAVDQITEQLGLEQYGTIESDEFLPVTSFEDGRVRDPVRVYAGGDPRVLTLQSDVPVPPAAVEALSDCVTSDLSAAFDRAVFLAGAPAESESQIGEVIGVATTDALEADLRTAGVELAEGVGVIGGVTGALVANCYRAELPAVVLVVRSNPYIPDPGAARAVIEDALEPFVEFDIDTSELQEQADEIQQQKQQIAEQLRQYQEGPEQSTQTRAPSMFQ